MKNLFTNSVKHAEHIAVGLVKAIGALRPMEESVKVCDVREVLKAEFTRPGRFYFLHSLKKSGLIIWADVGDGDVYLSLNPDIRVDDAAVFAHHLILETIRRSAIAYHPHQ